MPPDQARTTTFLPIPNSEEALSLGYYWLGSVALLICLIYTTAPYLMQKHPLDLQKRNFSNSQPGGRSLDRPLHAGYCRSQELEFPAKPLRRPPQPARRGVQDADHICTSGPDCHSGQPVFLGIPRMRSARTHAAGFSKPRQALYPISSISRGLTLIKQRVRKQCPGRSPSTTNSTPCRSIVPGNRATNGS